MSASDSFCSLKTEASTKAVEGPLTLFDGMRLGQLANSQIENDQISRTGL